MKVGRTPVTTQAELSHTALNLFAQKGFDHTTVDDIARAAGIGRRTFFRYFNSKNDLPWGEFDRLLIQMREFLEGIDTDIPPIEAVRQAVLAFNSFPAEEIEYHRERMRLLLEVPSLMAHSTLRYAAWREVIAEYIAGRLGEETRSLTPVTIAWACQGMCIGTYEEWIRSEDADLLEMLDEAFTRAEHIFGV